MKPERTAEQRAEEEAVRRQQAANPVRQRPGGALNQASFTGILNLLAWCKTVRQSKGLTLAEVAERMGIDAPALSRLETGKMLNPTLATLHKWAEALGQKLDVDLSSEKSAPSKGRRAVMPGVVHAGHTRLILKSGGATVHSHQGPHTTGEGHFLATDHLAGLKLPMLVVRNWTGETKQARTDRLGLDRPPYFGALVK